MSRIVRFFGVLRRNPKKSLFFSALFGYGINYGRNKYEEKLMMRAYCEQALAYGEVGKPLGDAERHITVLLNPAAKGGKGKAQFDSYCAPLLHLAGIKVATVRTEHEGQARDLMEIMENTSAVVVAGGDGTLGEVLTGLLRRADHVEAARKFPLGILPLGYTNTASAAIWGFTGEPTPRHLAEATIAIIKELKRPMDVMEIIPLQTAEQNSTPKPVYAASLIEWGAYRDAAERKETYWYWSVLKKYMTYVFSSYKDISWDCSAELEYTQPCSGCSQCCGDAAQQTSINNDSPETPRRWWMAYLPRTKPLLLNKQDEEEKIDYNSIINKECGVVHRATIGNVSDLTIATKNTSQSTGVPSYALSLKTGIEDIGAFEFIWEGWRREWNKLKTYATEMLVGEITLRPTGNTKTKEGSDRELNIDSEAFEVRPMTVRAKPKAVTVFAPATPPISVQAT